MKKYIYHSKLGNIECSLKGLFRNNGRLYGYYLLTDTGRRFTEYEIKLYITLKLTFQDYFYLIYSDKMENMVYTTNRLWNLIPKSLEKGDIYHKPVILNLNLLKE